MEFRTIKKGDSSQITPHFRTNEFYTTSAAKGFEAPDSHGMAQPCISAAEYLRTYFGTAWRITSGFRTEAHELAICQREGMSVQLAKSSQHVIGRAFDSQPANGDTEIMARIHADFLSRGELFQALRFAGITGFGIYDTFLHLDCRDTATVTAKQHDKVGRFAFWDSRTAAVKKKALLTPSPTSTRPTPTKHRTALRKPSFA